MRVIGSLAICGALLLALCIYAVLGAYVYLAPSLPTADSMRGVAMQIPLRVYSRSGQLIAQIGEQRRVPVSYEEIPQLVREAFVAAEDDRFFQHNGIDYAGVLRAVAVNLTTGDFSQGASTITMQAARNMFLTADKTVRRKLQEVFVTYRMENEFSKEQILDTYLNVIFFGQRSYGVAAAAEVYFGKSLNELSVAEVATLAGLPQAPSRYNPVTSPDRAVERRSYVLQRMLSLGYIDEQTAERARREPINAREFAPRFEVEAPYVAEMARQAVVARYGEAAINAGYKVITTIDGRLQTAANRALRLGLIEYDRRHGYRGPLQRARLASDASESTLDAELSAYDVIGNLQPAIVMSVAPQAARVYVRSQGYAQIDWDGLSWAQRAGTRGDASAIVSRGDIVYVVANGKVAQLAQLPEVQGALVSLDPDDGAVVALIGGFDYFSNKFNRATQAKRQPGSGFKPFLYSAALENGFTPSSILMDAPIMADDRNVEQAWRPENSGGGFSGPMRLREALVRSRNLVSIRLMRSIGPDAAIDYAARFGFDRASLPRNETLALGTLSATPLQVATGYATFANGGYKVEPYFIDRIENNAGQVLLRSEPREVCRDCSNESELRVDEATAAPAPVTRTAHSCLRDEGGNSVPETRRAARIISAANAWLMDDILSDVIKRGTGRRALALGRADISGKTGTTNESRDTWFNGFNRDLVATVWVGFDQAQPLGEGEEGSRTAVPIWVHYMREALRAVPDAPRPRPPGLVNARVSATTGLLTSDADPAGIEEIFLAEHLPGQGNPAEQGLDRNANGESLF
jgi:penicillin-binding protein 1A